MSEYMQGFDTSEMSRKEEEILANWKQRAIFKKTLDKESPKGDFVFYEGPPTANGRPGIHHLIPRAFKDVIPRYKTMRGFRVRRKAGWDTHGLPVEIETEKQLGLSSKKEIEAYGVAAFNEKCKESVWKYVNEWRDFTERVGYWVDLDDAYVTYYPQYTESVWNIVKEVDRQKLLYKDYKVLPWCPRCGTALSSHEVAQGYEDVKDLSVYVKFKVKGEKDTYLLAWTTTPWTLPGNVALAVGKDIVYVFIQKEHETLILAKERVSVLDGEYVVQKEVLGSELVGLTYEPLYPFLSDLIPEKDALKTAHAVYPADFVTTTDGTGIVHTAVMYGADDFMLGNEVGLPKFHLVDEAGHFIPGTGFLEGRFVKDEETAVAIIKDLAHRGLLFKKEKYEHSYPHCWRCKTPLIYYARTSWYIRMSELRDKLVRENEKINWVPEHIREGRFGEWLREVKDWAVSRDRYWGTPLPVWECVSCDHRKVVGSIDELLSSMRTSGNSYTVMRHANALTNEHNVAATVLGSSFDVLTEKGKEQARAAAHELAQEKPDIIFTSPFARTRETADIVAATLGIPSEEIVIDERLREIHAGAMEGRSIYEWDTTFLGEGWYNARPEGGESHADVTRRVTEFLFDIESRYQGKKVLIVTHGVPAQMLSAAAARATEETLEAHMKLFNETAEHYVIDFKPYPHNADFTLDLHKPYIDDVVLRCGACAADMRRAPEVMDVWLDSGAVPFAQDHYPFENENYIDGPGYPADFISEAIDQTRGWFYTLHAVGVLIGKGRAFNNVICLGHILDAKGKKMSKSVGNVINPWEMIAKYGVDPIRFWMYSVNQPGDTKNFDEKTVDEVVKKVFAVTRNVVKFYELYAGETPTTVRPEKSSHPLDHWIFARLAETVHEVTEGLDGYNPFEPTRSLKEFAQDLSTWYVRRSRDRFKSDDADDRAMALATTRRVILEFAKLMAPFTPFFAEELYGAVHGEKESVHLEEWPEFGKPDMDSIEGMTEVRRLASLALEARMNAGIKIRQPLARLTIRSKKSPIRSDEALIDILKDELNVKEVVFDDSEGWEVELDTTITPELEKEGLLRELMRALLDARKEANLKPGETRTATVATNEAGKGLIEEAKDVIGKTAHLSDITVILSDKEGFSVTLHE